MPSCEEIVDDLCARHPHLETGKLFGMEGFKANGKVAGGLWKSQMVFKLTDPAKREHALGLAGAHLCDPMGGRPMQEWVVVPESASHHWPKLALAAVSY